MDLMDSSLEATQETAIPVTRQTQEETQLSQPLLPEECQAEESPSTFTTDNSSTTTQQNVAMLESCIDALTTKLLDTKLQLQDIFAKVQNNANKEILVKLVDLRSDYTELGKSNISDLTTVNTQLTKEIA